MSTRGALSEAHSYHTSSVPSIRWNPSGVSSIEIHTRRTYALRLVRFKAFASLEPVGLDEFLIGGQCLLRFRQAADAAISLTQLKVCSVTIRRKLFCDFKTFDGAGGISLLEKRPAEFESGHFIVGLRQHHLAQKGHGLLGVSLHEKCVTEMIPGDRIGRAKFQLRAKLSGRRFEIALTQVDEAHEKVRFGKPRIKLQSSFHLREATGKVFLLRVGLPEEKVNGRIVRVLLQQPTEDSSGNLRLTRSNEGRTPSKEKPRIIRGSLEKWTQNLGRFGRVVSQEITEPEQLADEVVIGGSGKVSLERRNRLGIKLRAVTGQAPVTVKARELGLPRGSLPEITRGINEIGSFGAHHAKVVVGAGENFGDEGAVVARLGSFRSLLGHGSRRQPLLYQGPGALLPFGGGCFKHSFDAIGSMAFAIRGGALLIAKNVFLVVFELSLAIFAGVLERFFRFLDAAQAEQVL